MNWDQVEGKWKQMKGTIRTKWGKLTDSDYEQIAGSKDKFLGRLQERYGYTRDKAERELDEWMQSEHEAEMPRTRTGGSGV
jgi:uncharacterized protein YjbJ (UPF0337 family)